MKKVLDALKKNWIMVWFITAAFSLSIITAYAIYTRITIAKRVVSTEAGANSLFSSDFMNVGRMKTIEPFTDSTQDATVSVHVFNYAYPKEAVYRSEETLYDLKATLGTLNDQDEFSAINDSTKIAALSDLTYTIKYDKTGEFFKFGTEDKITHTFKNCSISGDRAFGDLFELVFDKNELGNTANNYCMLIEADPYNVDLPKLTGVVKVRFSKQATTGWKGELEELSSSKDYDGFNYYLDGNGKGKLTFSWNTNYVTINKDFLNNPENTFYEKSTEIQDGKEVVNYTKISGITEASLKDADGIATLTIGVDSSKRNRYEIQFFKVDPSNEEAHYDDPDVVEEFLPGTLPRDWKADE
ncbi:MAG: hypothetical protein IJ571_02310 [Ruminococcus sp.]|nr:hypothetical protein [Ruminococcus sp.]